MRLALAGKNCTRKITHHIINKDNITQFKKGSILINTARGPLVETQAVLDGLEIHILSGWT